MKKLFLIAVVALLSGCAVVQKGMDATMSDKNTNDSDDDVGEVVAHLILIGAQNAALGVNGFNEGLSLSLQRAKIRLFHWVCADGITHITSQSCAADVLECSGVIQSNRVIGVGADLNGESG